MLMFVYIVEIMFNLLFEFVCKPCACDNILYFLDSLCILNFIIMDYVGLDLSGDSQT
jgi:hypothetical protein